MDDLSAKKTNQQLTSDEQQNHFRWFINECEIECLRHEFVHSEEESSASEEQQHETRDSVAASDGSADFHHFTYRRDCITVVVKELVKR
jgi:hypothetical protein